MGLSASQVRYLSLTARQSNVEYQGQQINQARTELASQSSQLYQQMMALTPPVAPSIYEYVINPPTKPQIDFTKQDPANLNAAALKNFEIYYSSNKPNFNDFDIPTYKQTGESTYTQYLSDGTTKEVDAKDLPTDKTYVTIETGYQDDKEKEYYDVHVPTDESYTYNIKTGDFELKENCKDTDYLPDNIKLYNAANDYYSIYTMPTKTAIYNTSVKSEQVAGNIVGYETSLGATSNTVNQAQYKAAMAVYEREEEEYQKALDVINSKTEEIHNCDRQLETQLKQLDTDQEALQTELEAVKKVIEKNVEQTFKTFA